MDPSFLAKAWSSQILQCDNDSNNAGMSAGQAAIARTLPLFLTYGDKDATASVPFVCRYRTDIIRPLSTQQVHELHSLVIKHATLRSLREKLLIHFPPQKTNFQSKNQQANSTTTSTSPSDNREVRERIMSSTSKTELEDLYAPFKPPSKGSILERIQKEYPKLVEAVYDIWENHHHDYDAAAAKKWLKLGPREVLVQLLGTKIAAEPKVMWMALEELRKYCRVQTSTVQSSTKPSIGNGKRSKISDSKYSEAYGDFSGYLLHLKDHQVLAIRRGVNEKALKMAFEIDSEKMEKFLLYQLRFQSLVPPSLKKQSDLLNEAVHDAWTRLLRRRGTSRLWSDKCKEAQDRACQVFEDNLRRALLAPPYPVPSHPILALDPGFAAGIKCAVLDADGNVQTLETVKFVGNYVRKRESAKKLEGLLLDTQQIAQKQISPSSSITVALGNGHGSQECRELIQVASTNCEIPIDIQLVNEAGASVWSVTKDAQEEFPDQEPASIAAISIGRRLQNPLFELVKVPPKSLGLGMYQHDLSEKELDEKLQGTIEDAVATVGVMVNSCSSIILQKVPGLTASLAKKIIKARPMQRRSDLLHIGGLGPKTFENCAGFVRVSNGPEPLDDTLVHPESYDLARWLLKEFSWTLNKNLPRNIPPREEWKLAWKSQIGKVSKMFHVTEDRVFSVLENLVDSISKEDPRLRNVGDSEKTGTSSTSVAALVNSCVPLDGHLCEIKNLEAAVAKVPLRGIVGRVRNVADFGAFIDLGCENDGLLHVSKLGPSLQLSQLLIGQQIGVDILSASQGRISLGLHGCNLDPSQSRSFASRAKRSNSGEQNKSIGTSNGSDRSHSIVATRKRDTRKTNHPRAKRRKKQ